MFYEYSLNTGTEGFINITAQMKEAITQSGVTDGLCVVFCPHTTAGITINENADPDVVTDLLLGFSKAFPEQGAFRHGEGNSTAHLKASCVGSSVTVLVEDGRPVLGTWQGVYFCEFDGPRRRRFCVKII